MDAEIDRIAIIDNPLSIHSIQKNDRTVPYPLHEMKVEVKEGKVFGIKFTYQNLLNGSYKADQLRMILAHLFGESGPNANRWVNLGSNLRKSLLAEQILILVFIQHSETFRDMDLTVPQVGTFEIPTPAKRQRTLVAIKPKPVINTRDLNEKSLFDVDFARRDHPFFKRVSVIATTSNSCLKCNWVPTKHKTFVKVSKPLHYSMDCMYVHIIKPNGSLITYQPNLSLRCIDISNYLNDPVGCIINITFVHYNYAPISKHMCIEIFTMDAPPASSIPMIDDRDAFCATSNGNEDELEDICTIGFKSSSVLLCPITYTPMKIPVRSLKCAHTFGFFDYDSFILFGKFKCPICTIPIEFDDLRKSRYLSELAELPDLLTSSSSSDETEIIELD